MSYRDGYPLDRIPLPEEHANTVPLERSPANGPYEGRARVRVVPRGVAAEERAKFLQGFKPKKPKNRSLTSAQLQKVRQRINEGEKDQEIASDFGVGEKVIWQIRHNLTYKGE